MRKVFLKYYFTVYSICVNYPVLLNITAPDVAFDHVSGAVSSRCCVQIYALTFLFIYFFVFFYREILVRVNSADPWRGGGGVFEVF